MVLARLDGRNLGFDRHPVFDGQTFVSAQLRPRNLHLTLAGDSCGSVFQSSVLLPTLLWEEGGRRPDEGAFGGSGTVAWRQPTIRQGPQAYGVSDGSEICKAAWVDLTRFTVGDLIAQNLTRAIILRHVSFAFFLRVAIAVRRSSALPSTSDLDSATSTAPIDRLSSAL